MKMTKAEREAMKTTNVNLSAPNIGQIIIKANRRSDQDNVSRIKNHLTKRKNNDNDNDNDKDKHKCKLVCS